jgi:GNAT superfamily N-acetyltransferase
LNSFSHEIWEKMRFQLIPFFGSDVQVLIPDSWSNQYENWFKDIEAVSFRESLRYNTEELDTRLNEKNALILFIVVNEQPEGVILGYPVQREQKKIFYLDTFAVRTRGKGIGRIVLSFIIQWAKWYRYYAIELDTEAENEAGILLQRFYESLDFVVQCIEDDGNITMSHTL